VVCVSILAGCARGQGKKTFEFLKAEREILRSTKEELKKCSNPKPPSPPDLSEAQNGLERIRAAKEYRVALRHYWNTVQQNSLKAERVLNETETKISRLDSSGIGDDAINLATDYEHLLGSMAQIQVETKAIAELLQAELQENRAADAVRHLMAAALVVTADVRHSRAREATTDRSSHELRLARQNPITRSKLPQTQASGNRRVVLAFSPPDRLGLDSPALTQTGDFGVIGVSVRMSAGRGGISRNDCRHVNQNEQGRQIVS